MYLSGVFVNSFNSTVCGLKMYTFVRTFETSLRLKNIWHFEARKKQRIKTLKLKSQTAAQQQITREKGKRDERKKKAQWVLTSFFVIFIFQYFHLYEINKLAICFCFDIVYIARSAVYFITSTTNESERERTKDEINEKQKKKNKKSSAKSLVSFLFEIHVRILQ